MQGVISIRKSCPIKIVMHYPKDKSGWDELSKRVSEVRADFVITQIKKLTCPPQQKLLLLNRVKDNILNESKPTQSINS